MQEKAESFSRDDRDESEVEESASIPEEEFSKNGEPFSRVERDESEVEESASIPEEEISKNGEPFSIDGRDESGDKKSESILEEEDYESIEREYRGKKRVWLFIATGLCFLMGIGFLYVKLKKSDITLSQKEVHQKKEISQANRFPIPKAQVLIFHSFIIPFIDNKEFTYISLSVSFKLPNKELKREMIEKKNQLRGIIYDILREEINKINDVPPIEELKEFIIKKLNDSLSSGKVKEVYLTQFLAV